MAIPEHTLVCKERVCLSGLVSPVLWAPWSLKFWPHFNLCVRLERSFYFHSEILRRVLHSNCLYGHQNSMPELCRAAAKGGGGKVFPTRGMIFAETRGGPIFFHRTPHFAILPRIPPVSVTLDSFNYTRVTSDCWPRRRSWILQILVSACLKGYHVKTKDMPKSSLDRQSIISQDKLQKKSFALLN